MVKQKLSLTDKLLICIIIQLLIVFFPIKQKQYSIKINHIETNTKILDNKIKEYILEKKKEYLNLVKENEIASNIEYDFYIEVNPNEFDNIIYTHVAVYSFTGGAHYSREDKTFIYDKNTKKFLNIIDFLKSKSDFDSLTKLVRDTINEYIENEKIIGDINWINEGTKANLDNYQHFYLESKGLVIIFPPYQIASWAEGEVKVTIPTKEIYPLLKEKYKRLLIFDKMDQPTMKIINNASII